jgi:hypothetical protein
MRDMEDTIHHLQDDLEAELGPGGVVPPLPPAEIGPALPPVPQGPAITPLPTRFPSTGYPQGRSVGIQSRNGKVAFSVRIGG